MTDLQVLQICERIDLLRKKNGLSQEQLANALNISQPAVSKYLKNRVPPAETLLKLAQLGQTTVEWILTGYKSYAFESDQMQVTEKQMVYDADWQLAQKIASLPLEVREAVFKLIDYIAD